MALHLVFSFVQVKVEENVTLTLMELGNSIPKLEEKHVRSLNTVRSEELFIDEEIGEGSFGGVFKGEFKQFFFGFEQFLLVLLNMTTSSFRVQSRHSCQQTRSKFVSLVRSSRRKWHMRLRNSGLPWEKQVRA